MTDPRADLLTSLHAALTGGAPVRLDVTDDGEPAPVPPGTAVVVRTSGSTSGTGRAVVLSAAALRHSATATHARLGGPGQWLLAVPPDHIAGIQVLVRSVLAGTEPVALQPGPFEPRALAAAIGTMRTDVPRYVSLVPTQLHRVLAAGDRVRAALASCQAVLVGGAALDPGLRSTARRAGIAVLGTYGMTETCGGCVYDGVPLEGVDVTVQEGRVLICGPVLATGYVDPARATANGPFVQIDGVRWLRTQDAGTMSDGRLQVLGRLDDVIVTGGVNVHPGPVERAVRAAYPVAEVVVVGVADEHWGHLVTVVATDVTGVTDVTDVTVPDLAGVRSAVAAALGPGAQVPRALVTVPALPLRGPGKIDRRAVARRAAGALAAGQGQRYTDR